MLRCMYEIVVIGKPNDAEEIRQNGSVLEDRDIKGNLIERAGEKKKGGTERDREEGGATVRFQVFGIQMGRR